ncbi:3-phosphoshikimate 1-carboxyvinyltransferase [Pseudoalteromonas sp. SG45-5]|nr:MULTISPECIES: 3-phosphoshikimate 1-carboxyvinyltransferase [unclassified Pseudoalteromonas]MBB1384760.1 3-phosphoshikimate 1-carboxyvinyltransferase [Pseudoalteromonas sp. SG45-5]MBB1392589.1 3-phosphoshikimate 1-carboxyvinyltransferase [Pseudoalteromonas sp. SG44-4]MBB1446934.1 3-phosphoshikimate 1-carboxyvinyltransferase [Pseudoalteromonas sp. SG41-6]
MSDLRSDPAVRSLLERMPETIQDSFSDEQLTHLKVAIGARQWGNHAFDCRGVIKILKYRYYFVVLAGRNRRGLSAKEQKMAKIAQAAIVTFFILIASLTVILALYLIKSALGIDIFEGYSFGVWDWFKNLFK